MTILPTFAPHQIDVLSMRNEECKESCAVCWRDFTISIKPFLLPCGHSYCSECIDGLRTCPLCRRRIPNNYKIITNYSLLSLIEKNESKEQTQTITQETQTDFDQQIEQVNIPNTSNSRRISTNRSNPLKKQAIRFKFTRSQSGALEGMEISMG